MSFSSDPVLQANQLPISIELSEKPEQLIQQLELIFKRISNTVNTKTGGLYQTLETAAFDQLFTPGNPQQFRSVYRKVVDFGALPNAGLKQVAHGIAFDTNFRLVRSYASATDPVGLNYIHLPFSSPTLNENIKLLVDGTNVNVTTAINYTAYTTCYVIIEYVKF